MSDFIVLVKQVPDVSKITDNAFDPETGTLLRTRLPSVINELDAQALAFAHHMKRIENDPHARIIALTMGPPMAEQILQYSLARCVDGAVLLTDRALGGADTVATANPLAFAVRKIARELLKDTDTYYVISGMQSVDGDTAQVPAQLSEELGIPCVTYVTDVRLTKQRFEFTRIIQGGTQTVAPTRLPAVVTVANYARPLFASFARTRKALQTKVIQWGAQDIGASLIGVKGSKTAVIRVFPPGKSHRRCERIHDPRDLAEIINKTFQDDDTETPAHDANRAKHYLLPQRREHLFDRRFEGTQREQEDYQYLSDIMAQQGICQLSDINKETKERLLQAVQDRFHKRTLDDMLQGYGLTKPAYAGDVWVIAEQNNGVMHPATFELIGQARELADSLEVKVGVCLAGYQIKPLTPALIAAGADCVYAMDYKVLEHFDPGLYRLAVARTIKAYWPQIVLFAATPQGRVLAPMVSYQLKCGLTADCTGLDIRDSSRKGDIGILLQTRPALGGNVMATIRTKQSRCQMATARPGVMQRLPEDPQRTGEVVSQRVQLRKTDGYLDIIHSEFAPMDIDLGGAEVIVSGGRGMQSQEVYEALIGSFCETLRARLDTRVEKGASRAAVEQGFTTRAYQVGQTGTAVGPTLYVALGISGAIQHMIGISKSQTIIAINSDPEAPIFRQCDYYMIGQVEECLPRLMEALTNQQGDPS